MAEFFLADEKTVNIKGEVVKTPSVLHFKQDRAGFEGRATKEHVQGYSAEYGEFKKVHPDFKLPWGDDADFVGTKALEIGDDHAKRVVVPPLVKGDTAPSELEKHSDVKHKRRVK
jgi:hypothetical protein